MSNMKYMLNLYNLYDRETRDCLEYWVRSGLDQDFGGYLTYLDRKGDVFGHDKSVWFQGRGLYIFSKAYNDFDKSEDYLRAAKCGYDFLMTHCFDTDKRMFFIVTRDGRPIQKRRYFFSETFAIVGCAVYSIASKDNQALTTARQVFNSVMYLYQNPHLVLPKYNPDVIKAKNLAVPMILTTTAQTLRECDPENLDKYNTAIDLFLKDITNDFLHSEKKVLLETVSNQGEFLDSPAGRTVNPGHAIEASWFIMKEALIRDDHSLLSTALDILNWSFDIGWDKEYGGLLYFVDINGRPSDKLEWDMKLWWPHSEALIAFLMAYKVTGKEEYLNKFQIIHNYFFDRFRDREFGEWFGYLHRDGTVSNTLKGNLFKGPFHIPRALMLCHEMLGELCKLETN